MSRSSFIKAIVITPILIAASVTSACGDPGSKSIAPITVPQAGIETHFSATKDELKCLDQKDCSPVLVIDVDKFPESVTGLQVETKPTNSTDTQAYSQKHFKSHDGSGKFIMLLDKENLSKGYDLKIKPIYRSKTADGQESTLVNQIKVEALPNESIDR